MIHNTRGGGGGGGGGGGEGKDKGSYSLGANWGVWRSAPVEGVVTNIHSPGTRCSARSH